jgi:hypothetical protein
LLVVVTTTGLVQTGLAQTSEEPPAIDVNEIFIFFQSLGGAGIVAILIGLFTSALGYFSKTPPKEFKLAKFIYTFLISFTIAVVSILSGWNYQMIDQWLANGSLTIWIYWISEGLAKKAEVIASRLGWASTPSRN